VSLSSAKLVEGFQFKYNTLELDAIYGDVIENGKALGILLRY
jgi:hypothetical protein